jgi:hypothetical protein
MLQVTEKVEEDNTQERKGKESLIALFAQQGKLQERDKYTRVRCTFIDSMLRTQPLSVNSAIINFPLKSILSVNTILQWSCFTVHNIWQKRVLNSYD